MQTHAFRRLLIGVSLLSLMGWTGASAAPVQDGADLLGTPAPAWNIRTWINSEPLTLEALRGKVVLLRFWTDQCPFCAASAPYLAQWHARYAARGLVVIGLYHPKPPGLRDPAIVKSAAQAFGMTFPIAIDADWKTLHRYWLTGRRHAWTSVSFLIDQKGIIRYIHPGGAYSPEEAQEIEMAVQELLGVDRPVAQAGAPGSTG